MKCPNCDADVYTTCSNPDCTCQIGIEDGDKLMWIDGNNQACPHCGFVQNADYWEANSIDQFIKSNDAETLTEAIENFNKKKPKDVIILNGMFFRW